MHQIAHVQLGSTLDNGSYLTLVTDVLANKLKLTWDYQPLTLWNGVKTREFLDIITIASVKNFNFENMSSSKFIFVMIHNQ